MNNKEKIPNIELRSEEVQELMGKKPPLILRAGIYTILGIILLLCIASHFVIYPEIISIPVGVRNVTYMKEITATASGTLFYFDSRNREVCVGDTLAKILVYKYNGVDTACVRSPYPGVIYTYDVFQKNEFVTKNSTLCFLTDSISRRLTAKAFISRDIKGKIQSGMAAESSINDVAIHGKIVSITECASPINGLYTVIIIFDTPKELSTSVIWNIQANARIKIKERSLFYKFFPGKDSSKKKSTI
jgi:hypothetical protein